MELEHPVSSIPTEDECYRPADHQTSDATGSQLTGKPGYRFDPPRGKIVGDRPGTKVRYVSARQGYLAKVG